MTKQCDYCGNFYNTDDFGVPEVYVAWRCDFCAADLSKQRTTIRMLLSKAGER